MELAWHATFPRAIAALKERLVLGASRLHIGHQSGRYRDESYEGKTHAILPIAAHGPMMLQSDHECNVAGLSVS